MKTKQSIIEIAKLPETIETVETVADVRRHNRAGERHGFHHPDFPQILWIQVQAEEG